MDDSKPASLTQPIGQAADPPGSWITHPGEGTVLWVIWMTYGSFYFCRQNISAAVPGLEEGGLTKTQIGAILGAMKIAYAIGQLVNGQLAERFPARWLLAAGMLGSAFLNVIFGLSEGLYFLLFIWACNGYCQALGWTPCVRVAANWIPRASGPRPGDHRHQLSVHGRRDVPGRGLVCVLPRLARSPVRAGHPAGRGGRSHAGVPARSPRRNQGATGVRPGPRRAGSR
jgi:hypothetical protein